MVRLTLLMLLTGCFLHWTGRFDPTVVPDTAGYADFPFQSWRAALSHMRTPGYPAFLATIRNTSGTLAAVPAAQFAIYCLAIFAFHEGLRVQGCSARVRPWLAGSLLSSNILIRYVSTLAADTLAAAAGVASIGLLMCISGDRTRSRWWTALLALTTMSAWLVRPSYLFLAPLLPVAGLALWLRESGKESNRPPLLNRLLAVAVIVGAPILLWCSLRWMLVGSFGVVSFGGYNLIGISGQFLDPADVERLDERLRPLARTALSRRDRLPEKDIALPEQAITNYSRIELNYDTTIWKVFAPAARDLYGSDYRRVNTALKELGLAAARVHANWYALWLLKASRQALARLLLDFVTNPAGSILTVLAVTGGLVAVTRRWMSRGRTPSQHGNEGETVALLFVVTVLYAAASVATTIVVCPPLGRMTDAAGVFLPALVTATLFQQLALCSKRSSTAASRA